MIGLAVAKSNFFEICKFFLDFGWKHWEKIEIWLKTQKKHSETFEHIPKMEASFKISWKHSKNIQNSPQNHQKHWQNSDLIQNRYKIF